MVLYPTITNRDTAASAAPLRSFFSLHLLVVLLLLLHLLLMHRSVRATTTPSLGAFTGVTVPSGGANNFEQMVYDEATQMLYLPNVARSTVLRFVTELDPPWSSVTIAGQDGVPGSLLGGGEEIQPLTAIFSSPTGLAGWPYAGVMPSVPRNQPAPWVGLWIADNVNDVIYFMNFLRGNNITSAAGNRSGSNDGIGAAAQIDGPKYLTWGRFPSAALAAAGNIPTPADSATSTTPWTSMVLWGETTGHCVRQGIPLDRRSLGSISDTDALPYMVLNVTTFAGICGSGGKASGLAYQHAIFKQPGGIALVDPFAALAVANMSDGAAGRAPPTGTNNSGSTVLFVADFNDGRVVVITPLWPPTSRMLIELYSNASAAIMGLTVGSLRMRPTTTSAVYHYCAVDIIVGHPGGDHDFLNVTVTFRWDTTTGALGLTSWGSSTPLVTLNATVGKNVIFIPYGTAASLMIVGGDASLQYSCCLGPEYATTSTDGAAGGPPSSLLPIMPASLGNFPIPGSITGGEQLTYDPWNRTLYVIGYPSRILYLNGMHAVPIMPTVDTPGWKLSILAGGTSGRPSLEEVPAAEAQFNVPLGFVGWPQHATTSTFTSTSVSPWAGLFVCDTSNYAIRFINFLRGNNVTLVAGSHTKQGGWVDGIGSQALLSSVQGVVWAGFLASVVASGDVLPPSTVFLEAASQMVSVLLWTDTDAPCIRMGIPLHNVSYTLIDDGPDALQDMVLNVSTFAGVCSTGAYHGGFAFGAAVFVRPSFIVLVNAFTMITTTRSGPAVAFISDSMNHRVVMLAPLWPPTARFVTILFTTVSLQTMTIAMVRPMLDAAEGPSAGMFAATVEIFAGTYTSYISNITVSLLYNPLNGSIVPTTWAAAPQAAATNITYTTSIVFVPYAGGSLVVLCGNGAMTFEYYCCMGVEYAAPIDVVDTSLLPSDVIVPERLGTVNAAAFTLGLVTMVYDAWNDTLYLAGGSAVYYVADAITAPVTPQQGTPWGISVLAGGAAGNVEPTEVPPGVAAFRWPKGLVGWPQYATTSTFTPASASAWAGLFVCDGTNNALRFINFLRGGNVTLLAGRLGAPSGHLDGIGVDATLNGPRKIVWGGFLISSVAASGALPPATPISSAMSSSPMTSVILWTETSGNCVRQGIPLYNGTRTLINGTDSLQDMVLNISTFVGACGTFGSLRGLAYGLPVFYSPVGIALINPFEMKGSGGGPSVLFVSDAFNNQLVVISPLWPPSARFLTVLWTSTSGLFGVTVGRVILVATGPTLVVHVDLWITMSATKVSNVTGSLQFDPSNRTVVPLAWAVENRAAAATNISTLLATVFLPYPAGGSRSTLVVFAGSGVNATLQFFCCLGADYVISVNVVDNVTTVVTPPAVVYTATASIEPSKLGRPTWTLGDLYDMAYSPWDGTLYLSGSSDRIWSIVVSSSTVPVTPLVDTPWPISFLAGVAGAGQASIHELPPSIATFSTPMGIVGWPQRAVAFPFHAADTTAPSAWAGIYVCDYMNNVIRFINFMRGSNVTTVAGYPSINGEKDGMGIDATLSYPVGIAWGGFLASVVAASGVLPPNTTSANDTSELITVVLWTEQAGCVRQGIPMGNTTRRVLTSADALRDMVLDVRVFAGVCGYPGSAEGYAVARTVLNQPSGIALVNAFPTISTASSTIVVFVSDVHLFHLSVLSPLWPPEARFLTVVGPALQLHISFQGISVSRLVPSSTSSPSLAQVEVFLGTSSYNFTNMTVPLRFDSTNGTVSVVGPASIDTQPIYTNISAAMTALFVPYAAGTMILFSGLGTGSRLEFYCCLGPEYSAIQVNTCDGGNSSLAPSTSAPTLTPVPTLVPLTSRPPPTAPPSGGSTPPLGTPSLPFASTGLFQMAYDAAHQALYLAGGANTAIYVVSNVSSVPVAPTIATPWPISTFASFNGGIPASWFASPEAPVGSATFASIMGVAGWAPDAFRSPPLLDWAGLWLCDYGNHALRFMNFARGNNVTVVAGSTSGIAGSDHGVGSSASMTSPTNVVSGGFLAAIVADGGLLPPSFNLPPASFMMTSVILWTNGDNCVRQGIPLDGATLVDVFVTSSSALQDMVLNVSAFAGVCGTSGLGNSGRAFGLPVFMTPSGIALVNPFPAVSCGPLGSSGLNTTMVMFVSDDSMEQLFLLAPLWPPAARMLSPFYQSVFSTKGISVVRVQPLASSDPAIVLSAVDLLVGSSIVNISNATTSLQLHLTNGSISWQQWTQHASLISNISQTNQAVMVPHVAPYGSMVLLGGEGLSPGGSPVFQFYCCLATDDTGSVMTTDNITKPLVLAPLGSPISQWLDTAPNIEQMAYDAVERTLYFAFRSSHMVTFLPDADGVPTTVPRATWGISPLAGNTTSGAAAWGEVDPLTARFFSPSGIVGWSPALPISAAPVSWAGLFVCDHWNHALRFIHFQRGNNVTTVAGNGTSGSVDGIGTDALLNAPQNVVWIGALTALVVASGAMPAPSPASLFNPALLTSVILWTEQGAHCVRQGIPISNATGVVIAATGNLLALPPLVDMALNVSTFSGLCGNGGRNLGWIYGVPAYYGPSGIAAVNPFPQISNGSVIVFITEVNGVRLTMLSPLWPPAARYASLVYNGLLKRGVTVTRLRPVMVLTSTRSTTYVASPDLVVIELFMPYGPRQVIPIDVTVQLVNQSSISWVTTQAPSPTTSIINVVSVTTPLNSILVPHAALGGGAGTMVVFSGMLSNGIQFYCCLGPEYALPISVTDAIPQPPTERVMFPLLSNTLGAPQLLLPAATSVYPKSVNQITFDATTDTMYFCDQTNAVVFIVMQVSTLPVSPLLGTPWGPSDVLVGKLGVGGVGVASEVAPTEARFVGPTGILGWPRYAAEGAPFPGSGTRLSMNAFDRAFVGLVVCDYGLGQLRFINFLRGNNATLLAAKFLLGSVVLNSPRHLAWGRVRPSVLVASNAIPLTSVAAVTSQVSWVSTFLWSDSSNACISLGIPVYNTVTASMRLVDGTNQLQDMIFNVSTFVGLCGVTGGTAVGPAFNRRVLLSPFGVALMNAFPDTDGGDGGGGGGSGGGNSTSVLFIGDLVQRLVLVSPLWPPSARYVTQLKSFTSNTVAGVTIGRIHHLIDPALSASSSSSSSPALFSNATTHIEVFIAFRTANFGRVELLLQRYSQNGSIAVMMNSINVSAFATTTIFYGYHVYFLPVPYGGGSTMVLFSGDNVGYMYVGMKGLQFFCCLVPEYAATATTTICLDDNGDNDTSLRFLLPSPSGKSASSSSTTSLSFLSRRSISPTVSSGTVSRRRLSTPTIGLPPTALFTPTVASQARAATSATATAAGSAAFVATSTVWSLQRLDSAMATQSCPVTSLVNADTADPPPWLSNPGQWPIGGDAGAYWRASWVFQVFGNLLLGVVAITVTAVITYTDCSLFAEPSPPRSGPRAIPAASRGAPTHGDDIDAYLANVLEEARREE